MWLIHVVLGFCSLNPCKSCSENQMWREHAHLAECAGLELWALKSLSLPCGEHTSTKKLLIINAGHAICFHTPAMDFSPEPLDSAPQNVILYVALPVAINRMFGNSGLPLSDCFSKLKGFFIIPETCLVIRYSLHFGCKISKLFWLLEFQFLL